MGNWKERRRRVFYYQERKPWPPPPSFDYREPSLSDSSHDGVPLWEKKFCYHIGTMPWQKVAYTKKVMFPHCNNVVNWDDSGSEEAFHNAKKRYWAKINGLNCDISLPDSDIYIHDINWNPDIDPEMIKDAEHAYFAPEDLENDENEGHKRKKTRNDVLDQSNSHSIDNPWEDTNNVQCNALIDEKKGWGQLINNSSDVRDLSSGDNPWVSQSNTWVDSMNEWNNGGTYQKSNWNDVGISKERLWSDHGNEPARWRQHENRNNQFGRHGGAQNHRGWAANNEANTWGSKQLGSCSKQAKHLDSRVTGITWENSNDDYRKPESGHGWSANTKKSSKFQEDTRGSSRFWRGSNKH